MRIAIYDFIINYKQSHNGNSPSTREIGEAVGITSTSRVYYHLGKLIASGLIKCAPGQSRSIEVVGGRWLSPEENCQP